MLLEIEKWLISNDISNIIIVTQNINRLHTSGGMFSLTWLPWCCTAKNIPYISRKFMSNYDHFKTPYYFHKYYKYFNFLLVANRGDCIRKVMISPRFSVIEFSLDLHVMSSQEPFLTIFTILEDWLCVCAYFHVCTLVYVCVCVNVYM